MRSALCADWWSCTSAYISSSGICSTMLASIRSLDVSSTMLTCIYIPAEEIASYYQQVPDISTGRTRSVVNIFRSASIYRSKSWGASVTWTSGDLCMRHYDWHFELVCGRPVSILATRHAQQRLLICRIGLEALIGGLSRRWGWTHAGIEYYESFPASVIVAFIITPHSPSGLLFRLTYLSWGIWK